MRAVLLAGLAALAPTVATALTVSETDLPGGDFGNAFAARTVLPDQTDEIVGSAYNDNFMTFDNDYVAFTDLVPGSTFSVTNVLSFGPMGGGLRILDDTNTLVVPLILLDGEHLGFPPIEVATGTVPDSGELVFHIFSNDFTLSYQLQVDAPRVPEPGTALLLGVGLAAWRARARRRSPGAAS